MTTSIIDYRKEKSHIVSPAGGARVLDPTSGGRWSAGWFNDSRWGMVGQCFARLAGQDGIYSELNLH